MATGNARKTRRPKSGNASTTKTAEIVSIANHRQAQEDRNPLASEELDAALRETRAAVHAIIDEAESVLALEAAQGDLNAAAVRSAMVRILEVCEYEDLTGQRISKAAEVLRHSEARETQSVADTRANELNGPALNAPHMSQAQIDAAFAE